MAALILRLSDATLERLAGVAESAGVDVNTAIERLLDRDPHDHDHRCPTCARIAAVQVHTVDGQVTLFEESR